LHGENAELKAEMPPLLNEFHGETAELKGEVRELVWGTGRTTPAPAPAKPRPSEPTKVVEEEVEEKIGPSPEELAGQILETVNTHPDGIKLTEIGKFMGVDWRSLIGSIHQLVETGAIRKKEKNYFPEAEEG
ncbi:MAG: hypothetical protein ACE5JO_14455, partial [Candidatus Binatia bacterium]